MVATVVSQVNSVACEWCLRQGVTCIQTGDGARCVNCRNKHTRCSFVLAKVGEGRGTLLGMPHVKPSAGPQRVPQRRRGLTIFVGSNQVGPWPVFQFSSLNSFVEPAHREVGKRIREAISTRALFRTHSGICHSLNTLRWCLEVYDTEMKSIHLERAACEASVKELEEALKGELSTDEEEMACELAEEVQRQLTARKSTSAAAGDVEGGVCRSLRPSSKAKGKRHAN